MLLNIFVMTHVTAALMSFRLVALLPHHLPRLIGFSSANRIDMEGFYTQAAWGRAEGIATSTRAVIGRGAEAFGGRMKQLSGGPAGFISGPSEAGSRSERGMDTTLRAATDTAPREGEDV